MTRRSCAPAAPSRRARRRWPASAQSAGSRPAWNQPAGLPKDSIWYPGRARRGRIDDAAACRPAAARTLPPTLALALRHRKAGVMHAQRLEDAFGQEAVERHARDHFHQPANHVVGQAVVPDRARLVHQRQPGQLRDQLVQRHLQAKQRAEEVPFFVQPGDRGAGPPGVRQAGGVCQQMMDRDRAFGRDELQTGAFAPCIDLHVTEGRDVFRHWIVEQEVPFFVQQHGCGAGHRLRHRINAKDRVFLHGLIGFDVHLPVSFEVDHLATPREQRHHAGDLAAIDITLHGRADALQP